VENLRLQGQIHCNGNQRHTKPGSRNWSRRRRLGSKPRARAGKHRRRPKRGPSWTESLARERSPGQPPAAATESSQRQKRNLVEHQENEDRITSCWQERAEKSTKHNRAVVMPPFAPCLRTDGAWTYAVQNLGGKNKTASAVLAALEPNRKARFRHALNRKWESWPTHSDSRRQRKSVAAAWHVKIKPGRVLLRCIQSIWIVYLSRSNS
jgi:hypothetical protein